MKSFGPPDAQGRPPIAQTADEVTTLVTLLEYHRATLAWKCRGVDAAGLRATVGASTMTLGGLLKHLAFVEDHWFSVFLHGETPQPPWDTWDRHTHKDWEWTSAAEDTPEELHALWRRTVERSRAQLDRALTAGDLDQLAHGRLRRDGSEVNLRWIVTHMIAEYARHIGHADLLRESVDGEVGT